MEQSYNQHIQQQVTTLFQAMEQRVAPEEMERIKAAYALADEAHKSQKRKTGEPYIIHPIAVAYIVGKELMLGANPVIAAFLHDVVEDTPYTIEDIEERFGEDVAFLVRVVTKQKKEHYEMSKQLDNFKQMLDSVHYDIRAILIKLSDRLHNMRTLESMRPDKQMKIAGETDYFYAPLANRLGLYDIKTELENLSLRYRCPREYAMLEDLLQKDEAENRVRLAHFTDKISRLLSDNGIRGRLEVLYREPYSVWRKMQATGRDFKHLDYRHVIHIIFPDDLQASEKNTSLRIYSLLTNEFKEKPGGITNYIDSPKENGYQSFHVKLLCEQGIWEEIHISSERMVRNSRLGCVSDRTEKNIDNWIEKFKAVLQDIAYHSQENSFMESVVTSFYNDDIMVFTPQGRPIILPQKATALDFAFEIHSRIGEHAQYARVNGKLCSIKTVLHRGDCVEIGVNEHINPRPDWINHVLTYKAKRHLRSFLFRMKKIPYKRCPYCHPLPGDEVIGFTETDKCVTIHKRDCSSAICLASQKGDSIVSVNFEEDKDILYPVSISIKAVDRYHLLSDLIDSITNRLKLPIVNLTTVTVDEIVDCTIDFSVHSVEELQDVMAHVNTITGVDEVQRRELK
ncbi:bifunctional (p)ppGpp synthetase/guanosine-3',5'-bis(diphosphate) 3'-pyrophosphohydrolase [Parabacteroides sp. BX2]|mgnify:FL=1|jgi:GTP diphosphokinase / guanosine-3',5'-bis(diphosphate) 3'-diphosphatase|uniref:Bifunctional (P)ppGpp synthetase/guanosine-3',5'-bis(Diphosphate) 3'-pyrophosphohydrolase n=1 Tax=Parabacteroides segnis TaxID=2763058 RepID=A0ABR7E6P6_9BACT|nr:MULTISPECIES: HD domain-containing protein [Parabacteroides]MBC5645447.1 bifunctional (p)ppGpp synthetase/guanosine-3',5'-bis(diphosphate) 3'-pyrophosphohydrolase [Parabacteroides segnis]MCM0715351.1 HD domain-containing protein [Parabacteroides sp. TA-V-105]